MKSKVRRAEVLVLLLPVLGMSAVAVALSQRSRLPQRRPGLSIHEASFKWHPTKSSRDFDVAIELAVDYHGTIPKWWNKGVGGYLQNMRFVSSSGQEHQLHSFGMSGAQLDKERGCYIFKVNSDAPPLLFHKGRFEGTALLGTWPAGGFKRAGLVRFSVPIDLKRGR